MVAAGPSLIIGIAGGTASGKTTVANVLLERVGAASIAFLAHDAYYRDLHSLAPPQREQVNFDHPDSLETELMIRHLESLKRGESVDVPVYDFTVHARTRHTHRLEARPVVLVEGILVFAEPALRRLLDVKIFVDTPDDIRFIRRLQRDMVERGRSLDSIIHQYLTTVRPMHLEFVEPSKRYADVIIPGGGMNAIALDMVVARVEALLAEPHAEAIAPGAPPGRA